MDRGDPRGVRVCPDFGQFFSLCFGDCGAKVGFAPIVTLAPVAAALFTVADPNFREHVGCQKCGSVNRYRQISAILLDCVFGAGRRKFKSVHHIPRDLRIWNTERTRALHLNLSQHLGANYICSEYLSPDLESGKVVDGVLHVDMQKTHFDDSSLDYIISSDVMEHVPFYLDALRETHRVLKVGGSHIFTAPFYQHRFSNENRSHINDAGDLIHTFTPWYHGDPLRPEGVLCFNVFSMELLIELEKVGFASKLYILNDPALGILGNNGIVIVATKAARPPRDFDLIFPG